MASPERRWYELPSGVLTKLATKLADPNVRPKSTSGYSGTIAKVAGAAPVLPSKTFDASRTWQTPFRLPVLPEEVIVDYFNDTVVPPPGGWRGFITGVKDNEYAVAGGTIAVCAVMSIYMRSSNAQRMRSNDQVLRSNAEVLHSNAALKERMDEHDRRHKPFETSESSTLNAEAIAQLRQELKTTAANEKRLQSDLDQAKLDLSAKDKTIKDRDDTILIKNQALEKSGDELKTTKETLKSRDEKITNQSFELNSLKTKSTENKKTIADQKRNLESYATTVKDLGDQVTAKDDALNAKDNTIAGQERDLTSNKNIVKDLLEQLTAKDDDLKAKDNTIAGQERDLTSNKDTVKDLLEKLNAKDDALKAKDNTIADQKLALASKTEAMKTTRNQLSNEINNNVDMQKMIDGLEAEKSANEATINLRNTKIETQNRELESKTNAEKKIRDELATSVKSNGDLQKEVDSLKADRSAKDDTIQHLRTTAEIQKRHLGANAESEKKISDDLATSVQSNTDLQKELDSLKADMSTKDDTIQKAVAQALLAAKGQSNLERTTPSSSVSGPPTSIADEAAGGVAESAKGDVKKINDSQIDPIGASQDADPAPLVPGHEEQGSNSDSGYNAKEKPSTNMGPKDKDAQSSTDAPSRLKEGSASQSAFTTGDSAFKASPPSADSDHAGSGGKTQPKVDSPKLPPGAASMNELIGGQTTNTFPETITTKNDTDQPTPKSNDDNPVQDLNQGEEIPDARVPPKAPRGKRSRLLSYDLRRSIFREAVANAKKIHGVSCITNDHYSALAQMTGNFNGLQLRELVEQASNVAVAATQPGIPAIVMPEQLNTAAQKVAAQYGLQLTTNDEGSGQNESDSIAGTSIPPRPKRPMSLNERKYYLKTYRLNTIPRREPIDWDQMASLTRGFRADDIKGMLAEALAEANTKLRIQITQQDLESAISEMTASGKFTNEEFEDDEELSSDNLPSNTPIQNNLPTTNGNGPLPRPDLQLPPKPDLPRPHKPDVRLPPRPDHGLPPKPPAPGNQTPNQPANSQNQNYNGLPPNTPTGPRADFNTNYNNTNDTNSEPGSGHRRQRRGKGGKSDNKPSLPNWL